MCVLWAAEEISLLLLALMNESNILAPQPVWFPSTNQILFYLKEEIISFVSWSFQMQPRPRWHFWSYHQLLVLIGERGWAEPADQHWLCRLLWQQVLQVCVWRGRWSRSCASEHREGRRAGRCRRAKIYCPQTLFLTELILPDLNCVKQFIQDTDTKHKNSTAWIMDLVNADLVHNSSFASETPNLHPHI